jgi:hypothetical protein
LRWISCLLYDSKSCGCSAYQIEKGVRKEGEETFGQLLSVWRKIAMECGWWRGKSKRWCLGESLAEIRLARVLGL